MERTKGILLALISSGTFGLIAFFSIPLFEQGMHALSVVFYRSVIAAILIGIICLIRKRSFKLSKNVIVHLIFLGLSYTITTFGLVYSYNFIPSGVSTTIHFLYPIVVAIMMVVFFKEKLSPSLILAAIISIIGVIFLCWTDSIPLNKNTFIGLASVGVTIFTYAIYIVSFSRSSLSRLDPEVMLFYILTVGAAIFCVYIQFSIGFQPIPSFNAFAHLFGFAAVTTLISSIALIKAVQLVGSTITSILGSMEPLVATMIGVFYFNESFGWNSFIGLVAIIASVTMVVILNSKSSKKRLTEN